LPHPTVHNGISLRVLEDTPIHNKIKPFFPVVFRHEFSFATRLLHRLKLSYHFTYSGTVTLRNNNATSTMPVEEKIETNNP